MDQIKIGKFIARLRKDAGLTQEELGERLGVTNKTISRWENANYMPDIETFVLLSKEFKVSINELLAGERLTEENFKSEAEKNIIAVAKNNPFSLAERKEYFKKKWRKEHISLFICLFIFFALSIVLPLLFGEPIFLIASPLIAFFEYCYQNNQMMAYIESHL